MGRYSVVCVEKNWSVHELGQMAGSGFRILKSQDKSYIRSLSLLANLPRSWDFVSFSYVLLLGVAKLNDTSLFSIFSTHTIE